MFKKFIVATDFSEISERAAHAAVALAQQTPGAEVILVHVIAPGSDHSDPDRYIAEVRPGIEEQLRKLLPGVAGSSGVKVDWGVVDGRPAEELMTFATRWGGDMIVTGSTGRGNVAQMFLGSVAEKLVRNATVPVLVVGPKART